MKKLSKDEMKKVMGGIEDQITEDDQMFGCKGLTCKTSQECKDVNAGSCWDCSDGTKHCG